MYVAQDEEVVQEFAENNPLARDKLLRNGCYGTLSATCSGGRLFPEELTEETLVSRSFSDTWKADDAADSMHDFLWKTLWKPEPTLLGNRCNFVCILSAGGSSSLRILLQINRLLPFISL